jgi:glucose-1-phosphate thymidylyltransferase
LKAFVLAAGYATRMYPLTRDQPKPLLDVAGRPILSHLADRIERLAGLDEIIVISNSRFVDRFREWRDARAATVPVTVLDDGSTAHANRLGAVGDLAFALKHVPVGDDAWLVVAGDNLFSFELDELVQTTKRLREPTLVVREVSHATGPSPYNEVTMGSAGRVVGFREKPADPATNLAAIALYCFPPHIAPWVEEFAAVSVERDAPGHFMAWLVERTSVRAVPMAGEWWDVGDLASLERARKCFTPL